MSKDVRFLKILRSVHECVIDQKPICLEYTTIYSCNFLGCEECDQSLEKECTIHGFYSIIRDKTIPTRAKLTTPYQLTVKRLELRAGNNHGRLVLTI